MSLSPAGLPSLDLHAAWMSSDKPSVHCQHLSKLLSFLSSIPISYICIMSIRPNMFVSKIVFVFSLSLSLLSLSGLSFSSFTLSRMVPACKCRYLPFKWECFFATVLFCLCKAPRGNLTLHSRLAYWGPLTRC